MSAACPQIQFEGIREEIVRCGEQFAGKRVRVTVLNEADPRRLREAADRLLAEVDALQPDPNRPPLRGAAGEFAAGVADKLRGQATPRPADGSG